MLSRLRAHRFRNLEPLEWSPEPGRHLLVGGNGAGKTSVLEAIYAVATTRSFRTPRLSECVLHGETSLWLEAEVETDRRRRLTLAWSEADGLSRAVNGSDTPLAEHLSALPVVAWSAGEVEILTGAPAERRRFLDRGVVSVRPGALDALARYRRALADKRRLLSEASGGGGLGRHDRQLLASWNDLLADSAADVIAARRLYVDRLAAHLQEVLTSAALPFPEIGIRYRPSPRRGEEGANALGQVLEQVAPREAERGMPLVGPHRDDLDIFWAGHPVKGVASAGERKALSLLLVAAHGRVVTAAGRDPVYLLDDIDAELAAENLQRVLRAFLGARQLVATSNRPGVWSELAVDRWWHLDSGRLEGQ